MKTKLISGIAIQHDSSLADKWFCDLGIDVKQDERGNVLEVELEDNINKIVPCYKIANTNIYVDF